MLLYRACLCGREKLSRAEIRNGVDYDRWIFTKRTKTDTPSSIPLLPAAIKICVNTVELAASEPYTVDKLVYDPDKDVYYCPSGEPMDRIGTHLSKTATGFPQTITSYQARNCEDCPLRQGCHQQKVNRIIRVNHNLNRLKQQAENRILIAAENKKSRLVTFETASFIFGALMKQALAKLQK